MKIAAYTLAAVITIAAAIQAGTALNNQIQNHNQRVAQQIDLATR